MKKLEEFEALLARHRKTLARTFKISSQYRLRLVPGGFWQERHLFGNILIRYPREELWSLVALDSCSHWLRAELKERGEVSDSVFVQAIAHCLCFALVQDPEMKLEIWEAIGHNAKLVSIRPDMNMAFEGQGKLGAFLAIVAVPKFGIEACLDPSRQREIMQAMPRGILSLESLKTEEASFKRFADSLLKGAPC